MTTITMPCSPFSTIRNMSRNHIDFHHVHYLQLHWRLRACFADFNFSKEIPRQLFIVIPEKKKNNLICSIISRRVSFKEQNPRTDDRTDPRNGQKESSMRKYRLEKLLSEVTVILLFSRVTVTVSPRAPAFPPTLILSWRNFSREAISMILSSTGLAQSMTKDAPFFFPLAPPAAAALLIFAILLSQRRSRFTQKGNRLSLPADKRPPRGWETILGWDEKGP